MRICRHALYLVNCSARRQLISSPSLPTFSKARLSIRRQAYASVSAAELSFGQPVHETHPHLLRPGEITPGISALEYAQRRSKLAAKLPDNSIAIIAAAEVKYRSGVVFYDFHQDSSFFYLTGPDHREEWEDMAESFNEPEAVAVIGKTEDEDDHVFHLFLRPKDRKLEQWDGPRSGLQAAQDVFNADETGDISQIQKLLSPVVLGASEVYTDIPIKQAPTSVFARFFSNPFSKSDGFAKILESHKVRPLKPLLNDLRVTKSEAEIANLRKVGQISGRVITDAMRQAWMHEKDLAAYLDYQFRIKGCDTSAYVPVVAGGDVSGLWHGSLRQAYGEQNGRIIHYVQNDDLLSKGDLVVVDAGGEYGGYITDITRTWPVSGNFSPAQKDLYSAVLSVQRTCVSLCRADATITLDKLHDIAEEGLKDNLKRLGFDMSGSNPLDALFPHHLSHYIGLDVHDTPGMSRQEILKDGMCITVEPGLYIPNTEKYPAAFRGMGIRIEDSVCIGKEHPCVLTTEAVKEVNDIEALRK